MCGIFGIIALEDVELGQSEVKELTQKLFEYSESRGKESSGMTLLNADSREIHVHKKSIPAGKFARSRDFSKNFDAGLKGSMSNGSAFSVVCHSRLVTNGTQKNNNNNQPVIRNKFVAVHNGIITNVEELWESRTDLVRNLEVDTEFILAFIESELSKGNTMAKALRNFYDIKEGSASIVIMPSDRSEIVLATDNGSLYYTYQENAGVFVFASEEYILRASLDESVGERSKNWTIKRLDPLKAVQLIPGKNEFSEIDLNGTEEFQNGEIIEPAYVIENLSIDKPIDFAAIERDKNGLLHSPLRNHLEYNVDRINELKRCTKCVLPETFPFIEFDDKGVCNFCNNYLPISRKGTIDDLKKAIEPYRSKDGSPDCIIPFSGGRDSSYGLHYMVHELGLNPITFTYDWGMVTDLARRNVYRLTGKLGIEHILVSADIAKKRRFVELNVKAWLKKPDLGMIPLFMAGDKYFFKVVNQIKRNTHLKLNIWMGNDLENTNFKVGFANVAPDFDKDRVDSLSIASKMRLPLHYLKNFVTNPGYINSSISDTLTAYHSYYIENRSDFFMLFDYLPWNEKEVEETIINEYNWETSRDTVSTWRIGDGTAAFYNYIYYTVAGFSEFDTFRSNQIREGMITREEALSKIYEENRPRFDSIMEYLNLINVDFESAIKKINAIPKKYS